MPEVATEKAASATHLVEQAVRGDYPAWALSSAMQVVANHYRASPRISESQREDLLLAVVRAQFAAIQHLSRSYSRDQIAAGMQSARKSDFSMG
ncbi:hypothetical protein ACNJX9_35505 [Bradyrhizobium sp. DASA03076]|uniref:hypothetical protein n=1 Tax=Bradyrhizobium sp. BLXBL-03 TaxID=3395916 RepID=UPI003F72AC25